MKLSAGKNEFEMLAERALWWERKRTLIIADLHLGKASHFRKSGIAIPYKSAEQDYERLNKLIEKYCPTRIIVLGDLFHSSYNREWKLFCDFVGRCAETQFVLVKGNHDILQKEHYQKLCMEVYEGSLQEDDIVFSHEPLKHLPPGQYNFTGHVHPAYVIAGKAKDSLRLPCFYFHRRILVMPAFGSLTGLYTIEPARGAEIFVIAGETVMQIQ